MSHVYLVEYKGVVLDICTTKKTAKAAIRYHVNACGYDMENIQCRERLLCKGIWAKIFDEMTEKALKEKYENNLES